MKKTLPLLLLAILTMISLTACSKEMDAQKYIDRGLEALKESYTKESADKALELFLKAEELGDPLGSFYAGYVYTDEYPNNSQKQYKEATEYFSKCADTNPYANIKLGRIYGRSGNYHLYDAAKSEECFEKAAELLDDFDGVVDPYVSNFCLGQYYTFSPQFKDFDKAIEYYTKAVELGNVSALNNMGILYTEREDYEKAMEYYEQAYNQGELLGAYNIGVMYLKGVGVPKDYRKALDYFLKCEDVWYAQEKYTVGETYYELAETEEDYKKAMDLWTESFDEGFADAAASIGFEYYAGISEPQDYSKAFEWFKKGAECNGPTAMNNLASCYEEGIGVEQDYTKAFEWYQKSADAGFADAMESLADFYEKGIGCENASDGE